MEQKLLRKKDKAKGSKPALLAICTDLALHYVSIEQYSKAIMEYEIVANIYKDNKEMISYAQTMRGIGEAYMALHDFDQSFKYLKVYYDVATQQKNVIEEQRALAQMGHMYMTQYLELESDKADSKLLTDAYRYFVKSMKKCDSLPESIEKQDMIARLFSNLGLIKENLGQFETALNLYEKSARICLKNVFQKQLHRVYLSMASLFEKQEMYQETVKKYNLAIEVAKTIKSDKVELICCTLLLKSQTLIRIADFQGAKQVLRKAYKFKTPNKDDRKTIERNLRVVAGMCKIEDDLITCNDQKELKVLYEKMGDGACDLKIFKKAVEYYEKMLDAAEKCGCSDRELGVCYYSLGETYKDAGDYTEAEKYYEKEYNLCKDNLKDSLNTLVKIIDIKEIANHSVDSIKAVFERGLASCRRENHLKEERSLMIRYLEYLRRHSCHKDAFALEKDLTRLNNQIDDGLYGSSSSDDESEDSTKIHIGDDIVLSDVTDISEESDNEVPESKALQSNRRRRPNTVKFKKNAKGEWPLHVACIQGNFTMVEYWLGVDHPVNVRDNAGWLPLHEAASHGFVEIARLLLDRKASINDRGGAECNGTTPLHDAATNGHLEVVELLLDRGANAVAKTDDGHTPLFELKRWFGRQDSNLSGSDLAQYNRIVERLEEALKKVGQCDVKTNHFNSPSPSKENIPDNISNIGRLRRNPHLDDEPMQYSSEEGSRDCDDFYQPSIRSSKGASTEYQHVMQSLRNKRLSTPSPKTSPLKSLTSKRSALIDESECIDDDWLEDDVGVNKKRRTATGELRWGRSSSFGKTSKSPVKRSNPIEPVEDQPPSRIMSPNPFENMITEDFEEENLPGPSSYSAHRDRRDSVGSNDSRSSWSKRRTQTTLLDSGFSREKERRYNLASSKRRSNDSDRTTSQTKITSFSTNSSTVMEADSTSLAFVPADPMFHVDVNIDGVVYRVPILSSVIKSKTIEWLAEEAAIRYGRKEGVRAVLELKTSDGVVLNSDDEVAILFSTGGSTADTVIGKILELSQPSVLDRYREVCASSNLDTNEDICKQLEFVSTCLDLSQLTITPCQLYPIARSLVNQKTLIEINLSGTFFSENSLSALCSSLGSLPNLQILSLKRSGLLGSDTNVLSNAISKNKHILKNLSDLDLSDNISLGNCFNDLSVITSSLNLTKLNLSNTGLSDLLQCSDPLNLKSLHYFDLSFNCLKDSDIKIIAAWLDPRVLVYLDVSRNVGPRILRQILDVFEYEARVALQEVHLENCGVTDADLFDFLRLAPYITKIDLNCNSNLTSISLRRLLENGNLCDIDLSLCTGIWTHFDPYEKDWSINVSFKYKKTKFKILGGNELFNQAIVNMFRDKFKDMVDSDCENECLTIVVSV